MKYLWHVTLDTGHGRRSPRSEAKDNAVTAAALDLMDALHDGEAPIALMPGYKLKATRAGTALICTVFRGTEFPLVTFGVVGRARGSAQLWQILHDGRQLATHPGDIPSAPWCAVRTEAGLAYDPASADWLGDYERLIAWAWIEKRHER